MRTLTLEGVVPPFFAWPTHGADDADAALDTLIEDCKADASCARDFQGFRQNVDAAFATLRRAPVPVRVLDRHTGRSDDVMFGPTDLAYATRGLMYGAEALSLPRWFQDAANGRFEPFAQAYLNRARNVGREIATGVHLGVYCAEDLPYVDKERARREAAGTRIGDYLLNQYRRACYVWPQGAPPSDFRHPVRSSVPALLMTGRRDPVTPPRTAENAARTLSRARVLTWRYGAHGTDGLESAECRRSMIREFVASADPERIDVTCMTRDRVLAFQPPS